MDETELRTQLEERHVESHGWAVYCCSRDPAQAEEVLQMAYLKILQGKARFHGRSSFKTWLFGVIRNTAAGERRWNFFHRLKMERFQKNSETPAPESDPGGALDRLHVKNLFRKLLASLPVRQREVLQLVFYHDLSLAEAGEVMGISVGSARVHYERAKERLRQIPELREIR